MEGGSEMLRVRKGPETWQAIHVEQVEKGRVVAFARIYRYPWNPRRALVENLMVVKRLRGRGIGKDLLLRAVEEAQRDGVVFLEGWPVVGAPWLVEWYRRLGAKMKANGRMEVRLGGRRWVRG